MRVILYDEERSGIIKDVSEGNEEEYRQKISDK